MDTSPQNPKIKEVADKFVRHKNINTLDGKKKYTFFVLKRKEAVEVHYTTLNAVVKAFAQLMDMKTTGGAGDLIDFDKLWYLAERLLRNCCVNDVQIDLEDYYGDNPDELIVAVFHAVGLNYPKVFTQVRAKLKDSALLGRLKGLAGSSSQLTDLTDIFMKTANAQNSGTQPPSKLENGQTQNS